MQYRWFSYVLTAVLLSGCAQLEIMETIGQGRSPERLVASDLVNAMMQIDGLHPSNTRLQMKSSKFAFGKALRKVLETAGYEVQIVKSETGNTFVKYLFSDNKSDATHRNTPQEFQLDIGTISVKRQYSTKRGHVQPASNLFVSGADASAIKLNDQIFTTLPPSEQVAGLDEPVVEVEQSENGVTTNAAPIPEPLMQVSTTGNMSRPLPLNLNMHVNGKQNTALQQAKDPLVVSVTSAIDSLVYCYYLDANANMMRIYPNRFAPESRVAAGQTIQIPSTELWSIEASQAGSVDEFMCVAVDPALESQLISVESAPDLELLAMKQLDEVLNDFQQLTGTLVHAEKVRININ